jgi:hypothetical protein
MNANDETGAGGLASTLFAADLDWRTPRAASRASKQASSNPGCASSYSSRATCSTYGEAARQHQQRARAAAPPTTTSGCAQDLEFYRGLRGFRTRRNWSASGARACSDQRAIGTTDEIYRGVRPAAAIANGFRVNGADGEWLRHICSVRMRSSARRGPSTSAVQLLSMAITLKNHGYSDELERRHQCTRQGARARAGSAEVLRWCRSWGYATR